MRATGLNTFGYRKQIKEWIDLSMLKHTPISLLIMSRAFVLNLSKENRALNYEESLKTSISSMDEDVVNEVIVQRLVVRESDWHTNTTITIVLYRILYYIILN